MLSDDPDLVRYRGRLRPVTGVEGRQDGRALGLRPRTTDAPSGATRTATTSWSRPTCSPRASTSSRPGTSSTTTCPGTRCGSCSGTVASTGSAATHDRVFLRCFFPTGNSTRCSALKSAYSARSRRPPGRSAWRTRCFPGRRPPTRLHGDPRGDRTAAREDAALFEEAGERGDAYSGEEYRQELRPGLENPDLARRLRALPWGSGSGMVRAGADPGSCSARASATTRTPCTGTWGWPTRAPEIVADTLTCLAHAHADADT